MSVAAAAGAAPAAAGGAPGGDGAAPPAAGGWSISSLLRMLMMYWLVSSFFKGSGTSQAPVKDVATGVMHSPHRNAWAPDTPYTLYTFVHDSPDLDVSQFTAATLHPRSLIWFESGLKYGWEPATSERAFNWSMEANSWPMQHLYANGSLYAHVFLVKENTPLFPWRAVDEVYGEDAYTHTADALVVGSDGTAVAGSQDGGSSGSSVVPVLTPLPDPSSPSFSDRYVRNPGFVAGNIVHRVMGLNVFKPAPKVVDKKNLLGVGTSAKVNDSTEVEIFSPPPPATEETAAPEQEEEDEEELLTQQFLDDEEEEGASAVASARKSSKSLLKKKSGVAPAVRGAPWLSYWKPFLSIRLIPDWTVFPYRGIPAELASDYVIDPVTDAYAPPVYFDYFWLLQDQLIIVNRTVSSLGLNLTHTPLSMMKWRLETQMETSWQMQQSYGLQEADGRESEVLKRMIMDTNIYLLALTFVVSLLHALFDFLAFKNDVKFWKDAKSMRGLSTRSILMNAVCQIIIFFYLLDNDTSYMILLSSGVGCLIEVWKVRKAVTLRIDRSRPFPHVRIMTKAESEDKADEDKTAEEKELEQHAQYDEEAMKYLGYVLYPLIVCYAAYSLYYDSHKSWYSFILAVLTGCVYTFGFILMCPQLYINYKLKSVAHLPWRMLTYKALNTFIDDLFAFIIQMPTLHRLACFRDDLIFFIFLYQKWAYRVDFTRTNEFGAAFLSEEAQKKIEEEDRKQREASEARKVAAGAGAGAAQVEESKQADLALAAEPVEETTTADESTLRQRTQAAAASSKLSEMD